MININVCNTHTVYYPKDQYKEADHYRDGKVIGIMSSFRFPVLTRHDAEGGNESLEDASP